MTPRQFIQKYLDVSDVHYPDMLVNVKMMEDICQSYHEQQVKAITDVIDSGKMVASYDPDTKDWTTKYPNLLDLPKRK